MSKLRGCLAMRLAQGEREDPAVAGILDIVWCVEPHARLKTFFFSILCSGAYSHEHSRLKTGGYTFDVENLKAGQAKACGTLSFFELQREDAHADEIAPVNAFEAFSQDRLDAQ